MLFSSFPAFKLFLIRLGQQFLLDRVRTWCLFGPRPDAQCMDHFPAVEMLGCFTIALVDFNRVILGLRWDNIFFMEWLVVFFIDYDSMISWDHKMTCHFYFVLNATLYFLNLEYVYVKSLLQRPELVLMLSGELPLCEAREVHYPTSTPWWCVERRLQWLPSQGWAGISDENTIKYVPFSYE